MKSSNFKYELSNKITNYKSWFFTSFNMDFSLNKLYQIYQILVQSIYILLHFNLEKINNNSFASTLGYIIIYNHVLRTERLAAPVFWSSYSTQVIIVMNRMTKKQARQAFLVRSTNMNND